MTDPTKDGAHVFPFCGVPDTLPMTDGAEAARDTRWPKTHLRWWVANGLPDVMRDVFRDVVRSALAEVSGACGLTFDEHPQEGGADVVITTGRIDNRGSILAWSELPNGSHNQVVTQKYDVAEPWSVGKDGRVGIDLRAVVLHELLHGVGLQHHDSGIMRPMYDPNVRVLQPVDVRRLQSLYGPPKSPATPAAPPTPSGRFIRISITAATRCVCESSPDGAVAVTVGVGDRTVIAVPGYRVTPVGNLEELA